MCNIYFQINLNMHNGYMVPCIYTHIYIYVFIYTGAYKGTVWLLCTLRSI